MRVEEAACLRRGDAGEEVEQGRLELTTGLGQGPLRRLVVDAGGLPKDPDDPPRSLAFVATTSTMRFDQVRPSAIITESRTR